MSFKFNWPDFSDQFYSEARKLLSDALNTSNLPDSIVDRIHVKELKLGTQVRYNRMEEMHICW
ncbi:ERMES complex subunit, partial [Dispira parvispora]